MRRYRRAWLVVLSCLLVSCSAAAAPSESPAPPITPSSLPVRPPTPPSAASLPLRPPPPDPLAVADGAPILRLWEGVDVGGSTLSLTLYDDGSVVEPWSDAFGGPSVRRLSPAGRDRLIEAVVDTGAFDRSRTFDVDPGWDAGFVWYAFELTIAGRTIRVVAADPAAHPTAKRVVALGEAMRDLEAMLPAGSWVRDGAVRRPYLPPRMLLAAWVVPLPDAVIDLPDERIDVLAAWLPPELGELAGRTLDALVSPLPECTIVDGDDGTAFQIAVARRFEPLSTPAILDRIPEADAPALGGVDVASRDGRHLVRVVWQAALPGAPDLDCDSLTALPTPDPARYAAGPADVAVRAADGLAIDAPLLIEAIVQDLTSGKSVANVWYFTDGSVATSDPPPPAAAFGVRRLTPGAWAEIQALVTQTGLPDAPRAATTFEGATRQYVIVTADGAWLEATDAERDPLARRIVTLTERLADPAAWTARPAWIDPAPRPFQPSTVAVSITTDGAVLAPRATWAMVAWPLVPDSIGPDPSGNDSAEQCQLMAPTGASRLAQALRKVAVPSGNAFRVAGPDPGTVIMVSFDVGEPGRAPRC